MPETVETAETSDTNEAAGEAALCLRFEQAMRGAAAHAELVRRGRTLTADVLVHIGAAPVLLRIERGAVVECTRSIPLLCSTRFSVRGTAQAWRKLWEPVPEAGWHDLFALTKRGSMQFEGGMQPLLAHLQYVKDLLALPRRGALP
ncbi:hypothetical protein [Cupriavidus basilensis]